MGVVQEEEEEVSIEKEQMEILIEKEIPRVMEASLVWEVLQLMGKGNSPR